MQIGLAIRQYLEFKEVAIPSANFVFTGQGEDCGVPHEEVAERAWLQAEKDTVVFWRQQDCGSIPIRVPQRGGAVVQG